MERFSRSALLALLTSLLVAACGGGGNDSNTAAANGSASNAAASTPASTVATPEANAPLATGNTATDGLNWFNFRRQQAGVQTVVRTAMADSAAQGHSDYQKINNVITHEQTVGKTGFTGRTAGDRLEAAGYKFVSGYAYGEVISSTFDTSGVNAAEDLIAAIYHRFVILDPVFRQAGAGAATVPGGMTYFTTNFIADRLDTGLGTGKIVAYPFNSQSRVPRSVFSNNEVPDPVPDRNEVGYPVSVHADITSSIGVQEFTIRPRGGSALATRLLTHANDTQTPTSAVAIIPINVLAPATVYDVQFIGSVDGISVTRSWSFTTQ